MNNAPHVFKSSVKANFSANPCSALPVRILSEYSPHLGTAFTLAGDDLCANGLGRKAVEFDPFNEALRQLATH